MTDQDEQLFSESTELKRELGFTESTSIVISRIIGSGIFRTPGPMMIAVGAVSLFYGAWILGAIATILGAFLYAELVSLMPRSGGPYAYLKAAYPPVWTFLRGWAMFFVSETAAIAAVSLVFAEYTGGLIESFTGVLPPRIIIIAISIMLIWLHTISNFFGSHLSGILQDIFSLSKIGALIFIVAASFSTGVNSVNFSYKFLPGGFTFEGIVAVFAALRYAFFAYSGWEGATYVAEEVKNPRKNLPLSLFAGIGLVMILYLAVNTAYLNQLNVDEIIASNRRISSDVMNSALGYIGGAIISVAIMLSTFGNVGAQIFVKARTWYAMARDGLFFSWISKIHPEHKTPNRALAAQAIWATVLILFAMSAKDAYSTIIDFFSFTSTIFNISTFLAVPVLRKKYPNVNRQYRAWGYPFTLIIILTIYTIFAVITLYDAFLPSISGVLLTLTGLIYYYRESIFKGLRR